MKKYAMQSQFKTLLLLITMLWSSILFCATETVDGIVWRYTISNGEASVGGGKYNETAVPQSATGTIVIPATLGGKSVTSLAKCAFYQCSNITNVVIPSTVKSIGSSAFYNSGLSSIDIPDNVRTIDDYAFENCSNLENAKLPSDLKIIESRIFGGCSRLKSVNIPNGVECIKLGAFGACGFGNITIPGTVKSIHQEAFQNCANMTSLTISEGVKSIGASAFRNCSKLAVVRLPNGVVNIGDFAFENCSSLVSVTIPDSVVNLGKYVFRYCNGQLFEEPISGIKLVDGWVVQRTGTHSDHISLYGIRGICAEAFSGCSALYSVSFSSDIAGIGENAFYGCKNLFCDTDTICGVKLMNGWVVGTTDELSGDIDLTGVKGIVGGAFNGCATITSVKIPDGVRCIAGRTFQDCSSLTNIVIPASVTCIADSWTFASCKNLRNIILPRNLCYLGNYSFAYCNNLNSIYVLGDEPATGHWFLFYYDEPGAMVYVTDAWNGPTDMWYYSKLPIALPTYTITYDPGLYGSGSQQTVTKNKNIALTLKDEIFARTGYIQTGWTTSDGGMKEYDLCAQYTANADAVLYPFWTANKYTVTFDANGGDGGWSSLLDYGVEIVAPTVTRSGCEFTGWFTAAEDGNEVTVPAVVTGDITLYAHWMANSGGDYGTPIFTVENDVLTTVDLNGATEVTIPDGVTSIGRGAFYGCSSLTSVTIPNSVTNIGVTAFWGCSTLTNVTIPDSVAIIGDSAFMSCNRLTIVNLPATLREQDEHLRMDVFVDCAPDLELIYYGDSEEVWTFTVDAQQRYPWNGKVDITYTLSGDVEAEIVMVSATDRETDETYTASSVTGDLGATAGTHRIVWDMGADGLTFKSTNVVFTVSFAVAVSDAHVRVRLWDDGPYWATTNIGAEEPWEYGYYFWWGDTVGYRYENDIWVATDGTSRGFSFGSGNVPTYGKDDSALYAEGWVTADGILALEHDAAQMQWGGDWRMPTADELAALNSNCDWMWTVTNGVNGYVVRGRGDYANNSIFLPAAGCGNWGSLSGAGSYGGDWSSVPSSGYSYNSWLLDFSSGGRVMDPNSRYHGRTVRPVQGANVATPAVTGTSGAKVIDLMHGRRTAAAVEQIRYSTDWGNGASVNATNAVAVVEVDGVVLSAASGSGFAEWVPSSDGIYTLTHKVLSGGLQIGETFSSEFLVTGFTPCWTVTFDLDGHGMRTGGGELVQSVTNGCIAVVPTVTANEGWTFTGWSGDVTAAIVGNTTFTAQWEEEEASPYTWSYLDNGDGTITITDVTPSPVGDLTIPSTIAGKSVTGIGDSVFRGCNGYYDHDSLTGITIPDGVQSIGAEAFSYCYHLTRVTVPDSVTNIGSRAFLCCTQLRDLIISDSNLWYKSVDGLLLSKDGKNLLRGVDWSVPIPDSVTNIESYAFFCCDIASITIPDGVMRIGEHAFANCSGLTSMTIPDSVTSVEGWAFANCSGLVSVTIGSGVVDIGDGVFGGCTALTSFVVTEGNPTYKSESGLLVTADGSLLVAVPYNLTNVTIPEGVTSIGDGAFRNNSGLVSVTIPAGVTNIENSAFSGCSGLTSVTLPGGMTRIEDYTFMGCSSLVSITIPDSVTLIRSYAFSGCTGLTNITIGSGVMSIGAGAFANCSRLASMTFYGNMPNVFHLNNYAYMDSFYAVSGACVAYVKRTASGFPLEGESWNGLTIAYLPDDTPDPSHDELTFTFGGDADWIDEGEGVWRSGRITASRSWMELAVQGSAVVSFKWKTSSQRTMAGLMFEIDGGLRGHIDGELSDWVSCSFMIADPGTHMLRWTYVNAYATETVGEDCGWVKDIAILPVTDCTVMLDANGGDLSGDEELSAVVNMPVGELPEPTRSGYTFLGWFTLALGGTPVTEETVVTGDVTFYAHWIETPPYGTPIFTVKSGCLVSVDLNGATDVTIPYGVTSIGDYAFSECDGLTSVIIPDSVTSIGCSAFECCSGLTSVTIPTNVTSIGDCAFGECSGLTYMTIPDSVTSIGSEVFYGCDGLMGISVGAGNMQYKSVNGLILSKDGRTLVCGVNGDVVIPDGVEIVGYCAFSGCRMLASVTMPESVTNIGQYAFCGCYDLRSVTIPAGVARIGNDAFGSCYGLESATFEGDAPTVGSSAFYPVNSGCMAYVKRTAIGFPAEGESWNGLTIAYLPDDTPDPSQDEVTFTAPEPWEANGMQVVTLGTTFTAPVVTNEFTVTGTSGFEFAWDILATNWWFMAAETENGSIIAPAADWMADGTNFVLSAIPTEHYHFVRWTGDTEGCAETSGTLEVTMDRPRTVGAEFEINSHRVSISETLCDTIPFIGEIDLVYGSIVTVEVVNAVIHCGAARYVCKGWMATNSDPESGEGARAELRVLGDVLLNWLWETNVVTLAQSVNAEDLDWTAGGASDWQPEWSDVASDGIHQARCGTIPNGTNAWLAAMVEGPGTLTFKWRSALVSRNTKYQFMVDGEVKGGLTGTNGWTEASVSVFGDRTHEIKWRLVTGRSGAAGGDWVALDEVVWTPTVPPTLAEALNTNLVWTTDGDVVWRGVTRESLTDARDAWAVVSGLGDDGTAAVQTRVYGSGVLSFDWSISCEEDYDWMELTVDGEVRDYVSGSVGWTQTAVEIVGDGWHTVRWEYVKDEMDDAEMVGDNIAKLDNVVWISDDTPPAVTETQTTPIPVPYAELEGKFSAYLEQAKGDYEVAAKMTGRNGYAIWESYVAGLEPENEHSKFTAKIEFRTVDGRQEPVVTWDPDRPELRATRIYTTYGKKTLLDHDWTPITDANKNEYNFFKVEVKMK